MNNENSIIQTINAFLLSTFEENIEKTTLKIIKPKKLAVNKMPDLSREKLYSFDIGTSNVEIIVNPTANVNILSNAAPVKPFLLFVLHLLYIIHFVPVHY